MAIGNLARSSVVLGVGRACGVLFAGALLLSGGCASRYFISPARQGPEQASSTAGVAGVAGVAGITRNVVLVSIDGLRPDAIDAFGAKTLQRLMRGGTYTLSASTVVPSKTLPSHTSMLTGEAPDRHGVYWNTVVTAKAKVVDLPTIFSVARSSGYGTAAFFSKPKFHPLQRPGTLDYSQAPGGWFGGWSGARTARDVENYLASARPNVLFVHLIDPDTAGHSSGWMSTEYGRAVITADAAVASILSAAERAYGAGNFTVIATSDHGGHGRDHGSADARDVTIPWIAWGRGVKPGELTSSAIRTMDTASTVLWLLGLQEPTDWMGTPVLDAFRVPATAGDQAIVKVFKPTDAGSHEATQ